MPDFTIRPRHPCHFKHVVSLKLSESEHQKRPEHLGTPAPCPLSSPASICLLNPRATKGCRRRPTQPSDFDFFSSQLTLEIIFSVQWPVRSVSWALFRHRTWTIIGEGETGFKEEAQGHPVEDGGPRSPVKRTRIGGSMLQARGFGVTRRSVDAFRTYYAGKRG